MSFWRASLSCLERLSAIFDGLVLRMSLLSNCMKSSNSRSRSLFGVHQFFFLKENNLRLQLHSAIYRPDSFVLVLRYCANLKAIRYESTSFNRIVADKSHRVIAA